MRRFEGWEPCTAYEYDDLGRQVKVTLPDPDPTDAVPAPYNETHYNKDGNVGYEIYSTLLSRDLFSLEPELRVTDARGDSVGPIAARNA